MLYRFPPSKSDLFWPLPPPFLVVSGAVGALWPENRSLPQDLGGGLDRPLRAVVSRAGKKDQSRQAQNHRCRHPSRRGVSFKWNSIAHWSISSSPGRWHNDEAAAVLSFAEERGRRIMINPNVPNTPPGCLESSPWFRWRHTVNFLIAAACNESQSAERVWNGSFLKLKGHWSIRIS